jgi:DNA modification methylase
MIHNGDCIEVMATFEPESIDAIVTDPPYGLGFMGKAWDNAGMLNRTAAQVNSILPAGGQAAVAWNAREFQSWCEAWAREAYRVAKPGAHLLAFGGTRTYHRLATAIEDAGWEIRDTLVWAYASGFPKSLDVSKAIDKAAGAEREVVGIKHAEKYPNGPGGNTFSVAEGPDGSRIGPQPLTAPATDLAREWQGWGTALKPAWEPIVLARKPLRGTVAGNVTEYGTGALNIDGCRIDGSERSGGGPRPTRVATGGFNMSEAGDRPEGGRWPANVILTDPIFDGDTPGVVGGEPDDSRFFLVPKAARSDREPVIVSPLRIDSARHNVHPTVKPTDLMRHLVRLVTPPGGVVLDPFLGSGTTAIAAELEGFEWVGIEREAEYCAIAEARLNGTQRGLGLAV